MIDLVKRIIFSMRFMPTLALFSVAYAQNPVVKVDLNMSGRQEAETNEPGFTPWIIKSEVSDSLTVNGVKIKFSKIGTFGTTLSTDWNKAGIQAPYYARLVNDGITIKDGNDGGQLEMRIKGLPAGKHTLLTYHNGVQSPTAVAYAPIDIFLNGSLVVDNLKPTIRALKTADAQISYLSFTAQENKDVVILFTPETSYTESGKTVLKNIILNGFEINTPNSLKQSKNPVPANRDEHVLTTNNSYKLSWGSSASAVSHDIYFGTDSLAIDAADHSSPLFKGNQLRADSSYTASSLYSMSNYFWRVDEVASDGVVFKGNTWRFKPAQLAFPDAEGYGRFAIGGRGGKVVEVTNLNDSGPGSLREAVTNNVGPRTIVFKVSGIITLQSRLVLSQSYVTIAGQTAPGKGICIKGAPFGVTGNDAVVRNIRVRVGAGPTYDGMGLTGANHSIVDHCSISWTIDEAFSSRGGKNITLQRTLISEALNVAGHQNYPVGTAHGYAATIGGDVGSFHHNLLAHCYGRNWSLGGGLDAAGYYSGRLEITNNVVYNWGSRATDGGAKEVNFINNYYKPGAGTTIFYALSMDHEGVGLGTQRAYFSGNVIPAYFNESNQTAGRRATYSNGDTSSYQTFVNAPFFASTVTTQTAKEAYKRVLSDVGATQPVFDDHDIRIVNETINGTYLAKGSVSGKPGFPDHQNDVGGYENYPETSRFDNWDTDHDGLPDWWEKAKGLNPNASANFSEANADPDHDGYTNLEDYLEWMANPHFSSKNSEKIVVDLKKLSSGYTSSPVYSVSNPINGQVVVNGSTAEFTPAADGLGSFSFSVSDSEGGSMTRKVNIVNGVDLTLPVTLISFDAKRKNGSEVVLKWETSQEVNNDYFEVQKAYSENAGFVKTGDVVKSKAKDGSSSGKLSYEFKDNNSFTGNTYYRLVQVDKDARKTVSETKIVAGINETNYRIWPVPNNGRFSVITNNQGSACLLKIYDTAGKQVASYSLQNGSPEQVYIANPGVYILKFTKLDGSETLYSSKVVVN